MKKQVTLKDIAGKLGISTSTVSRALQDHPDISIKTRQAVQELAKILGYKPNLIALHLKHSRTNTIGLVVPEVEHYFFSTIINGIEDVAYQNNFNVLVVQSNESYLREVLNTQTLLANRVDGVLASFSKETQDFSHFQQLIDNEIPLVFYDRVLHDLHADSVMVDDYSGAFKAVSHLIERGCKRIAFYSAPQHLLLGKNRLNGYKDALDLLKTAGPDVMAPLRTVLEADEIAQAYDTTRRQLETEATRIVRDRVPPVVTPGSRTRTVSDVPGLEAVTDEIRAELQQGPVEVTWRRTPKS